MATAPSPIDDSNPPEGESSLFQFSLLSDELEHFPSTFDPLYLSTESLASYTTAITCPTPTLLKPKPKQPTTDPPGYDMSDHLNTLALITPPKPSKVFKTDILPTLNIDLLPKSIIVPINHTSAVSTSHFGLRNSITVINPYIRIVANHKPGLVYASDGRTLGHGSTFNQFSMHFESYKMMRNYPLKFDCQFIPWVLRPQELDPLLLLDIQTTIFPCAVTFTYNRAATLRLGRNDDTYYLFIEPDHFPWEQGQMDLFIKEASLIDVKRKTVTLFDPNHIHHLKHNLRHNHSMFKKNTAYLRYFDPKLATVHFAERNTTSLSTLKFLAHHAIYLTPDEEKHYIDLGRFSTQHTIQLPVLAITNSGQLVREHQVRVKNTNSYYILREFLDRPNVPFTTIVLTQICMPYNAPLSEITKHEFDQFHANKIFAQNQYRLASRIYNRFVNPHLKQSAHYHVKIGANSHYFTDSPVNPFDALDEDITPTNLS
jgi:hypothetical protein